MYSDEEDICKDCEMPYDECICEEDEEWDEEEDENADNNKD